MSENGETSTVRLGKTLSTMIDEDVCYRALGQREVRRALFHRGEHHLAPFLASDDSELITGAAYAIDGGSTA